MTQRSIICFRLGFSLVELSIVLVILGLLIGGVLTGQNLIKAAELRKLTNAEAKYNTAILAFRDKYFALPGDLTNATAFWKAKWPTSCVNNSGATVDTADGTCDGDGDGAIYWLAASYAEYKLVWEQLALAGLIEGKYDSTSLTGIGTFLPAVGARNAGALLGYVGTIGATPMYVSSIHTHNSFNMLRFGADEGSVVGLLGGITSPEEAWNIDTKIDDGRPGTGRLLTTYNASDAAVVAVRCVSAFASLTANYNFQYSDRTCVLNFKLN